VNFYKTNATRKSYGFSWREEYLLGMLYEKGEMPTKEVITNAVDAMSENTTHKYLMKLVLGGYVVQLEDKDDKRFVYVRVTDKGRTYLKDLNHGTN
jgi:DNA-binding MarR family transcriptional regulator